VAYTQPHGYTPQPPSSQSIVADCYSNRFYFVFCVLLLCGVRVLVVVSLLLLCRIY
jgi:hypothetical protein